MRINNPLTPELPSKQYPRLRWRNLHGSSLALALVSAAEKSQTPLLVIVKDNWQANQLLDDLNFFQKGKESHLPIFLFPDWETLPYDQFSPHRDLISQRLYLLSQLPYLQSGIIVTAISTLMHRLPPCEYIGANSFHFKIKDRMVLTEFRQHLQRCGYFHVAQVMEHGEFSVRGSIVDIYPMGNPLPYRIDFFDDEIESIRSFDPETQLSLEKLSEINLLPSREFSLSENFITRFRQNWRAVFTGNPSICSIYEDVSNGIAPAGIEYYLSLFFEKLASLTDYLPENTIIARLDGISLASQIFWQEVNHRYEQQSYDITRPILIPSQLFIPSDNLFAELNRFLQITIDINQSEENIASDKMNIVCFETEIPPSLLINSKKSQPLSAVFDFIAETNQRLLFCAESSGRREVLLELLKNIGVYPEYHASWRDFLISSSQIAITEGLVNEGLVIQESHLCIITEAQLFGEQVRQQRRRKTRYIDPDIIVRDLTELKVGSPVVHIDYGVARYLGLQILEASGVKAEYLTLEYAGSDKVYVPVTSLNVISRYTGVDSEHVQLNKLGNDKWVRTKKKALEKIHDVAVELLEIYAKRQAQTGIAYPEPDQNYYAFASRFPFEETPDQERAIHEIMKDFASQRLMDRLVCGDVGFGKTEVAMRAAFLAVQNEKQVAVLVPTTLLAEQHYQTFLDRFSDTSINIDHISRFRTAKEQENIIKKLSSGQIDIIIGTHKLIQKGIQFKNLGLLIIDEEHRFGVRQKEQFKALRSSIDILALTATPIPRTLNMSMAGMRDISIIATPPAKRLAIKTFVQEHNPHVVRDAILREIMRGGQVFFLHNNIETIQGTAHQLQELVAEAKIVIAHGQMHERDLERIMADFYHHRYNVLVCTTIIENGIDIPTANTIIIDRADKFGLAQLHQLRGRVGRSQHQAYAYLITPNKKVISKDALKRLEAIVSLEELGSGFTLATHDLEIRGAGELLGEEQSGHIQEIGFALYMELLEKTVKALKFGKQTELSLDENIEISLHISAIIPEDYVPDMHLRLTLYKRIANAKNREELHDLQAEFIDRFGLLPISVKYLFRITELKQIAATLGIKKIEANLQGGFVDFEENPKINPDKLIELIQKQGKIYKLSGPQRLRFTNNITSAEERIEFVFQLLRSLGNL